MMVYLTRRYRFSASHRLHNEALSAEENARLYGKCNNPFGHGHNYVLDVTVAGTVSPTTGMVVDVPFLDRVVNEEVLDRLDHTNLNLDVDDFRTLVPTTENLCSEIFRLLLQKIEKSSPVRLEKVRLEETRSNFFEIMRD